MLARARIARWHRVYRLSLIVARVLAKSAAQHATLIVTAYRQTWHGQPVCDSPPPTEEWWR